MAVAGSFYPAGTDQLATTVDELLGAAPLRIPGARRAWIRRRLPGSSFLTPGSSTPGSWRRRDGAPSCRQPPSPHRRSSRRRSPRRDLRRPSSSSARTTVPRGSTASAPGMAGRGGRRSATWTWTPRSRTRSSMLGAPFGADTRCHLGEHSLEVQLPFVARLAPGARIVALSVGAGTGPRAIEAGERLGRLLAERRSAGRGNPPRDQQRHGPLPAGGGRERVTAALLPHVVGLDPENLATAEAGLVRREPGVSCGMCGIEPTVLGLAALRAMGVRPGLALAAATSADAGRRPAADGRLPRGRVLRLRPPAGAAPDQVAWDPPGGCRASPERPRPARPCARPSACQCFFGTS